MPNLISIPSGVLSYLSGQRAIRFQEIVGIEWVRGTQKRYYASTDVDAVMPGSALTSAGITSVIPAIKEATWMDIPLSSEMGDDQITVRLTDTDGAIRELYADSGDGSRVTVYYWLPDAQVGGYLGESFIGLMGAPKDSTETDFVVNVYSGLRAVDIQIPRRTINARCSAIFGGLVNPETGTPYFTTQYQIDQGDCPYNKHIGGSVGVPGFTSCPRDSRTSCAARIGDKSAFMGFDIVVKQTRYGKDNRFVASTRANESAMKQPIRVIAGYRFMKETTVLSWLSQLYGGGYTSVLFAIGEGEIESQFGHTFNGHAPTDPIHLVPRNGTKRQDHTGHIPDDVDQPNYSGLAYFKFNRETGNTAFTADQLNGNCYVYGKKIRVYSSGADPEANYTVQYTNSRAWWLLEVLTNPRWGLGYAHGRFNIQDFIDLDTWCSASVYTVDDTGAEVTMPRTQFDAILEGTEARELIRNICSSGRISPPFYLNGKLRVMPITNETLSGVPVFDDTPGADRNILPGAKGVSSLQFTFKSDKDLTNQVKLIFEDGDTRYFWNEHPIIYSDEFQQMHAGVALGDLSQRINEKTYSAFGTTRFGEAVRLAKLHLHLGEFDSGGLFNNLSISFDTWYALAETLKLHKHAVIQVVSPLLIHFIEPGASGSFEFFRIQKIKRTSKLTCRIEAQAYPVTYYATKYNSSVNRPVGGRHFPNKGGIDMSSRLFRNRPIIFDPATTERTAEAVTVKLTSDPYVDVTLGGS